MFKILTGTNTPVVEIINKDNAGAPHLMGGSLHGAVLASGGGGGGGGVGKAGAGTILSEHADGASGASAGQNANALKGILHRQLLLTILKRQKI